MDGWKRKKGDRDYREGDGRFGEEVRVQPKKKLKKK